MSFYVETAWSASLSFGEASLSAGVPTIVTPVFADQAGPFALERREMLDRARSMLESMELGKCAAFLFEQLWKTLKNWMNILSM